MWEKYLDPDSGYEYYYNPYTNVSQWDPPHIEYSTASYHQYATFSNCLPVPSNYENQSNYKYNKQALESSIIEKYPTQSQFAELQKFSSITMELSEERDQISSSYPEKEKSILIYSSYNSLEKHLEEACLDITENSELNYKMDQTDIEIPPKNNKPEAHIPTKRPLTKKELSVLSQGMNRNYISTLDDYNKQQKYSIYGKSCDDIHPLCALCHKNPCVQVFFPCQHKCICNSCLKSMNIGPGIGPNAETAWRACPVCMEQISYMILHVDNSEEEYWNWVHEIKPPLPWDFEIEFKRSTKKLVKKHAIKVQPSKHKTFKASEILYEKKYSNCKRSLKCNIM